MSWPCLSAMIHLCTGVGIEMSMTQIRTALQPAGDLEPARTHGDNTPQPIRSLRDWLDHLAARDRLVVVKPGIGLRFDLAAIAKRLDGLRATLFPRPGGHSIPVVSGLISDHGWMAEAMGVEPGEVLARFQEAARDPIPWRETASAPAQEVVHRHVDLERLLPLPTHNEHDGGPYVTAGLMITRNPRGKAERLHPSLPIARAEPSRRVASAASRSHVLRDGGAGGPAARSGYRRRD
jgi:3-octaprenyl-4-hydroxybenzoate carboxy-lyase N-terminal domain/3-octaprenyl-4-hydroxybenzoate carboxy-lyase Rift-related domain